MPRSRTSSSPAKGWKIELQAVFLQTFSHHHQRWRSHLYNALVSDLKGKTVFITGAARRLGKAIALAMAQSGANVAFTYLQSVDDANKTLAMVERAGPGVFGILCDVRKEKMIVRA